MKKLYNLFSDLQAFFFRRNRKPSIVQFGEEDYYRQYHRKTFDLK